MLQKYLKWETHGLVPIHAFQTLSFHTFSTALVRHDLGCWLVKLYLTPKIVEANFLFFACCVLG